MENTSKIYVRLLEEGIEVFRPVRAIKLSNDTYKILSEDEYNPETETWEFPPGTVVKGKFLKSDKGGEFLAATSVNEDIDDQK